MKKLITNMTIRTLGILLVLLTMAFSAVAQKPVQHIVVNQHDTIEFTVEQFPGDRYTWDIYTDPGLNFALENGHLDPALYFVDGMYQGSTVRVTNLDPGIYYVRVMVWDDENCTNNLILYSVEILEVPEADLYGEEACFGDPSVLRVILTGTGPWEVIYTDGVDSHTVNLNGNPDVEQLISITPFPIETTDYWITYIKDLGTGGENLTPGEKARITIYPIPVSSKIKVKDD